MGHALGFNSITLRLGLATRIGQVGPRGAGSGRGLSGVGEGLGMHWASEHYSKGRAEWGWGAAGHALRFN